MGSLAKEFLQTTRSTSSPKDPGFNPEAYGSEIGKATVGFGKALGDGIQDTMKVFGTLVTKEQESKAALAGAKYELGLKDILLDLEETTDHNEWEEKFETRSSELRNSLGKDFSGSAGNVFNNRATVATGRQGIAMRTGVHKRRVEQRRGDTLTHLDTLIELGSDRPESEHRAYLDEIGEVLDNDQRDLLLPADEVARLRIWANGQMSRRHESKRISGEADEVVGKMLELHGMIGTDEDPDGDITEASVLKTLDGVKDGRVSSLSLRRYKERRSAMDAAKDERDRKSYDDTFDKLRSREIGADGIPTDLPASMEKSLIASEEYFRTHSIGNKSIKTNEGEYRRLMEMFMSDRDAFAKEPLWESRLDLDDGNYSWFEARQDALNNGTGDADKMVYKGDIRWQATQAMQSLSQEDEYNTASERAGIHLEMRDALEVARDQKRASTNNPNADLSSDEAMKITDQVIIEREISIPNDYWFDPNKSFDELTKDDVNNILDEPTHELRMRVTTDVNKARGRRGLKPLDSDHPFIENQMIDYLETRGAPRV